MTRRNLHDALSGHCSNNVAEAVKYSERSNTKCIGRRLASCTQIVCVNQLVNHPHRFPVTLTHCVINTNFVLQIT
jgi:hypothetical protein